MYLLQGVILSELAQQVEEITESGRLFMINIHLDHIFSLNIVP